jgi:hypothetical protein
MFLTDCGVTPITPIVITAMRRAVRTYLEFLLPDQLVEQVRNMEMDLKVIDDVIRDVARPMGFGNFQFVDMRYEQDEEDFITVSVTEPYSLPMCAAYHAAALEAILGYDHGVKYDEVSPGLYYLTAFSSKHEVEFAGRMSPEIHHHVPGDIEMKRYSTCGGPAALAGYNWHLERGVILKDTNGQRMAMISPH